MFYAFWAWQLFVSKIWTQPLLSLPVLFVSNEQEHSATLYDTILHFFCLKLCYYSWPLRSWPKLILESVQPTIPLDRKLLHYIALFFWINYVWCNVTWIPLTPDRGPNPHFLEKRVSGSKNSHFPSFWKREFSVKNPLFPTREHIENGDFWTENSLFQPS